MKGYKTLCEDCVDEDDERDAKQIGPLRPDTGTGRCRANADREIHRRNKDHSPETVSVEIEARTKGGYVFDEVDE